MNVYLEFFFFFLNVYIFALPNTKFWLRPDWEDVKLATWHGCIDDEAAHFVSLAFPNHEVSKQIQFTCTILIHKFVEGCDTSLCR